MKNHFGHEEQESVLQTIREIRSSITEAPDRNHPVVVVVPGEVYISFKGIARRGSNGPGWKGFWNQRDEAEEMIRDDFGGGSVGDRAMNAASDSWSKGFNNGISKQEEKLGHVLMFDSNRMQGAKIISSEDIGKYI